MRDKVTKITRSMKRITALLTLFLAMTFISCKSGKTVGENPFFAEWETPYGVPPFDKIEPEHFLPAIERGMSLHEAEIDAITSNNDAPTFENVILAYDASGKMLSQVELIFGMLCAATRSVSTGNFSNGSKPSTTVVPRWDSTPSRAVCWRRPTAVSCAPERCSTPSGRRV